MEKHEEIRYVKRTQKDYSMSFKLQVVQEIEQGRISTYEVCLKYGIQSRSLLLVGFENLVTLIWKIKHHLICQNLQSTK